MPPDGPRAALRDAGSRHASLGSVFALLLLTSVAQAQSNFSVGDIDEVVKDFDAPEKKKLATDVVILPEGYQDRADFMKKARALAKRLRPRPDLRPHARDHDLRVLLRLGGVEGPGRTVARNGEKPRDTPFSADIEKDGTLATDDGAVDRAMKHVLNGTKKTTQYPSS